MLALCACVHADRIYHVDENKNATTVAELQFEEITRSESEDDDDDSDVSSTDGLKLHKLTKAKLRAFNERMRSRGLYAYHSDFEDSVGGEDDAELSSSKSDVGGTKPTRKPAEKSEKSDKDESEKSKKQKGIDADERKSYDPPSSSSRGFGGAASHSGAPPSSSGASNAPGASDAGTAATDASLVSTVTNPVPETQDDLRRSFPLEIGERITLRAKVRAAKSVAKVLCVFIKGAHNM